MVGVHIVTVRHRLPLDLGAGIAGGAGVLNSAGRGRNAPRGVDRARVDWMVEPDEVRRWTPSADTILTLVQEWTLRDDPLTEMRLQRTHLWQQGGPEHEAGRKRWGGARGAPD